MSTLVTVASSSNTGSDVPRPEDHNEDIDNMRRSSGKDGEKRPPADTFDIEGNQVLVEEGQGFNGRRDPFADGLAGGVQYKTLSWWQAGMVMIAETVSLGILSLPSVLAVLGIIPGVICILGLGVMATYSGYVMGQLKVRYPHIHSFTDAGEILGGAIGRELLGAGQLIFFVFIMGSHILTFSIMMNAITNHATCTIIFSVVGAIVCLLLTLPRTLKNMSYLSIVSFLSVIGAVMVTMIGVSITKPSQGKPIALWAPAPSFHEAFLAVANIVFAYAGHVAFFSFMSELKDPNDFPRALCLLQASDISMYTVTAIVIYYYAGSSVASPAMDSASNVVRKVAYGVAMPTIVIAGVVNGHVAVKCLYVRLFRNSEDKIMHQKTWKAYGIWALICSILWFVAWIIAEGVPVFNDLLGLTSALFASWFTFGLSGTFWLHLNRGDWFKKWKKMVLFGANVLNLVLGLCVVCTPPPSYNYKDAH